MYYRHFALDGPPFRFAPSAAVLYLGDAHRECLAALEWALLHDECGFMLLVGETGTGKTTLLNAILAERFRRLHLACVTNPRLSFEEIMRVLLPQLGVTSDERGKLDLIQSFERAVASQPEGHRTAIVIDEAQDLSDENLEDLRLLANRIGSQDRELQIVLMGHPELLDRLSAHNLRQLRERIATKVSLLPLSPAESVAYVECRLAAQGGSAKIFDAKALRHLVEAAGGIPRRLNVLCHNALVLAYSKNANTVTTFMAREVVSDYESLRTAAAKPPRTPAPEMSVRAPSIRERRPAARDEKPAIRPRGQSIYTAGAYAAVLVIGVGSLFIPTTQNWADEINRAVPAIAGLVSSAGAKVAANSSADNKTVDPAASDTPSIASTLGYTQPTRPAAPLATAPVVADNVAMKPARARRRASIQIHAGDTFHDLAARYLGSEDRAWDLIKANPQIKNPDDLRVGEVVYLPSTEKGTARE